MDAVINDVMRKKTPRCRLNHVEWGAELLVRRSKVEVRSSKLEGRSSKLILTFPIPVASIRHVSAAKKCYHFFGIALGHVWDDAGTSLGSRWDFVGAKLETLWFYALLKHNNNCSSVGLSVRPCQWLSTRISVAHAKSAAPPICTWPSTYVSASIIQIQSRFTWYFGSFIE